MEFFKGVKPEERVVTAGPMFDTYERVNLVIYDFSEGKDREFNPYLKVNCVVMSDKHKGSLKTIMIKRNDKVGKFARFMNMIFTEDELAKELSLKDIAGKILGRKMQATACKPYVKNGQKFQDMNYFEDKGLMDLGLLEKLIEKKNLKATVYRECMADAEIPDL